VKNVKKLYYSLGCFFAYNAVELENGKYAMKVIKRKRKKYVIRVTVM